MKKNRYTVFRAWLLLFCFAAGQYMIYVHQHKTLQRSATSYAVSKSHQKSTATVQEKCYFCDAMHHVAMVLTQHVYHFSVTGNQYVYKQGDYDFVSISLILSSGRAPPVVFAC